MLDGFERNSDDLPVEKVVSVDAEQDCEDIPPVERRHSRSSVLRLEVPGDGQSCGAGLNIVGYPGSESNLACRENATPVSEIVQEGIDGPFIEMDSGMQVGLRVSGQIEAGGPGR